MRIALPVSSIDAHKLPQWIGAAQHFGGMSAHDLIIVPTRSVTDAANDAKEQLQSLFSSITVYPLDMDPEGGWPKASNLQFLRTAEYMAQSPLVPFLWNELDMLPSKHGCYDAVGSAYASSGVACLGSVVKTPWRDHTTNQIVQSPEGAGDVMMCGCGVYPGNFYLRPTIRPLMDDFAKGVESATEPWDVYLRYAMRREGMGHTELIADMWNTVNYRTSPTGQIICDAGESKFPARARGGAISPMAVLVHGCKDDSLFKLITSTAPVAVIQPPKDVPESASEVSELKKELADFKAILAGLIPYKPQDAPRPKVAPRPQKKAKASHSKTVGAKNGHPADDLMATVAKFIKKAPKSVRAPQVEEALKLQHGEVGRLLDKKDCPFEITSRAGWLKLKAKTS